MLRDVFYHNMQEKVGVILLVSEHCSWKNRDTSEFQPHGLKQLQLITDMTDNAQIHIVHT
jgi:hypothetical protein